MKIMFNMMNGARMGTGLQALAYASAAYLYALDYARSASRGATWPISRIARRPRWPSSATRMSAATCCG
jgi:alkylation response protein AidB-like acyl-CoA dehydrogenase